MRAVIKIKEDFLINVVSEQGIDNHVEKMNLQTRGTFKTVNGENYLVYREYEQKNSSLRIIKFKDDNLVSVIKNGKEKSKLVFQKGKNHHCPYSTPQGDIIMKVSTNDINVDYSDEFCNLELKYSIFVNFVLISENTISVKAKKM